MVCYYVLEPLEQPGARFFVPVSNQAAVAKLKPLLSREELEMLLSSESVRENVWIDDEGRRKQCYRELISSGDRAALLTMICSIYRHKRELADTGKKVHLCDENFLKDAQKLLSAEFSLVLGIPMEEIAKYISDKVNV